MQSLLFGTTGLNVFGSPDVQTELLQHLTAVCLIGEGLGATRLVFGSPKNRDRNGLSDEQVLEIAISFFRLLGHVAQSYRVIICLEPNPTSYGANFMTTSEETAAVVILTAHPAIRMQLDTGALTINDEQTETLLQNSAKLIGHIHASEPDLVPLGDGSTNHAMVALFLMQLLPEHIVAIKMLATKNESHSISIDRSLSLAIQHYRNEVGEGSV